MAHKTLINGTSYDISGGKTLINGTSYGIEFSQYEFDPTKMSYTEEEFIECLNAGYASQLPLNCKITLNNGYCSSYKVIGTNHGNTNNTVDLLTRIAPFTGTWSTASTIAEKKATDWEQSSIRTILNDWLFNAFYNEVKSHIVPMTVVYGKTSATETGTCTDNVKALSVTETGISNTYVKVTEGTKYPAFNSTSDLIVKNGSGANITYWLRSKHYSNGNVIGFSTSFITMNHTNTGIYMAGVIRFQ